MAITTIFDFTSPSDYTLSNISISDAVASLSLVANPGQTFSQPFTSSSGFTFNSSYTSITGGILSQIAQDITPTLTNAVNGTTGTGSFTKTSGGTGYNAGCSSVQTITGNGYVQVTAPTTGTIGMVFGLSTESNPEGNYQNLNFAVNFNGSTAQVYELGISVGSPISYTAGDLFQITVNNTVVNYLKNGTIFYTSLTAATFPMYFGCSLYTPSTTLTGILLQNAATTYLGDVITFPEFTYSGLGSIIEFTGFTTGGDVNAPGYVLNGQYWNGMAWVSSNNTYAQSNPLTTVNMYIEQLPNNNSLTIKVITTNGNSAMSITGPLTVTYSGQIYPTSGGTIQSNSSFSAQEVLTFASQFSESGSDSVTFALGVNGQLMYWNGSAWANSNGTFSQTNSVSVLNTNASTLLTVNSNVEVFALLVSGTGSTTPNITNMKVQYSFGAIEPTAPVTTIVFGFLRDIQCNPISGATIVFSLINLIPNAYMAANEHVLMYSSVTATTDVNGYFEQPVIATTQFQGTNTFVQVIINYNTYVENVGPTGTPLYLTIPIQESIDITSILSA